MTLFTKPIWLPITAFMLFWFSAAGARPEDESRPRERPDRNRSPQTDAMDDPQAEARRPRTRRDREMRTKDEPRNRMANEPRRDRSERRRRNPNAKVKPDLPSTLAELGITEAEFQTSSDENLRSSHAITRLINERVGGNAEFSQPASDEHFLRRITLDLAGRLPSVSEIEAYRASNHPDKKTQLVDRLLADPRFGVRLADLWVALLFDRTLVKSNSISSDPLRWWLENEFNRGTRWDSMARQLVASQGPQDVNPAVTMFMGGNKGLLSAPEATNTVSRAFLGVQLECAQCHDHPFADWQQKQFWGLASFFRYVKPNSEWPQELRQYAVPTVKKRAANGMLMISSGVVDTPSARPINEIEGALEVPPRLLTNEPIRTGNDASPRRVFAEWLTSPQNPFFARAMVNRLWSQYFGRGLINPVDNLKLNDTGWQAELLQKLADEFVASQYDVKLMVRAIVLSDAYGCGSSGETEIDVSELSYSHMPVRAMDSHQLFESLAAIVGENALAGKDAKKDDGLLTAKAITGIRWERGSREKFVEFFAGQITPTAYHRGTLQMLRLMNDASYEKGIQRRAEELASSKRPADDLVRELFMTNFSRRPTPKELSTITQYIRQKNQSQAAYQNVLWALLQSSEFVSIP